MDVSRRGLFTFMAGGTVGVLTGEPAAQVAPWRKAPTAIILSARRGAPETRSVRITMDNGEVCEIGHPDSALIGLRSKLEVDFEEGHISNVYLLGRRLNIVRG
jgi:hypothetical protein